MESGRANSVDEDTGNEVALYDPDETSEEYGALQVRHSVLFLEYGKQ